VQSSGKYSNRFILSVDGVDDIPKVALMVQARASHNMVVLDAVTCEVEQMIDPALKGVVVATMYDQFFERYLPKLQPPWPGAQKHQLQPGHAVFARDPATVHPSNCPQLGIKILHFTYGMALHKQLRSLLRELNAKATTLNLLSPCDEDMDKSDKAFCFASDFVAQISDILAGMSDALHNAKARTLRAFEDDNTFWPEHTKCGRDKVTLQSQIYAVLNKAIISMMILVRRSFSLRKKKWIIFLLFIF
jgi:hypothetical protein